MISSHVRAIWDTYHLPQEKCIHCELVARVADFFAVKIQEKIPTVSIDRERLKLAALLHDIDKGINDEHKPPHPQGALEIVKKEGLNYINPLIASHPLHTILDPSLCPKTWEEKLLFLADKMVKYEVLTVEKRFSLWEAEDMPDKEKTILRLARPNVLRLEHEILSKIGISPDEVAKNIEAEYTDTIKGRHL